MPCVPCVLRVHDVCRPWGSRGSGLGAYYIIINSISTQFDDVTANITVDHTLCSFPISRWQQCPLIPLPLLLREGTRRNPSLTSAVQPAELKLRDSLNDNVKVSAYTHTLLHSDNNSSPLPVPTKSCNAVGLYTMYSYLHDPALSSSRKHLNLNN